MKKYYQAPWNISEIVKALASSAILIYLLKIVAQKLGLEPIIEGNSYQTLITIISFVLQWIVLFTPIFIIGIRTKKLKWESFGFIKYKIFKTILLAFKGFLIYIGVSLLIGIIIVYYNIKIPGYQLQPSIFQYFGKDTYSLIASGIIIVIIAPILEEMLFRGVILRTLSDKWGIVTGSLISAFLFSLMHMPWQSIIPIFILALIINSLVIKSKSIWPAISFHILNNAIAFTVQIFILKDIISIETLV